MGAIVTWLIVVIVAIMLLIGVFKAARAAAVPITILVVVVLTIALVRAFFTKDNLNKLHDTVEQTGIGVAVEQGLTGAIRNGEVSGTFAPIAVEESKSVEKAPAAVAQQLSSEEAPAVAPAPAASAPVAVDYRKYDKGKKTYKYALPFNATVNMSFRRGGYRFIVESVGQLSAGEKKEIGQLMLQSLAKYRGEPSSAVDKSKVSIEVKYDTEDNRTQVFIVVQLDAVE